MHLRSVLLLSALLALPTLLVSAGADPAAKPAPPTPRKLTLAQVLASLPLPADGGLMLTVSSEQVTLPDGTEPPPADASLSDTAAAFGGQTFSFGGITAVAPSTMVLLNTQPDPPDVAADMNSFTDFKMLSASLDEMQWQALTSERGLGLSDLSDDTQRGLFHALFPHNQLWIGSEDPALIGVPQEKRADVQNVSDQINDVRIRLGQSSHLELHDTDDKPIYHTLDRPDAAQRLHIFHPKHDPLPTEHGVELAASVPNTLKPSDLDYDRRILQVPVSAAGAATVGDLVTHIGLQTKLELYVDPHYAARTLTVQGMATEPAADLLQALCVCVTGTFRKVGPAYVLTDDLIGVGTRRKRLSDWEDGADHQRSALQDQAGSVMLRRHAADARKLPTFGDPLALTTEEMASLPDAPDMPGLPENFGSNSRPFAKLTAAQQAWMRQAAAEYNEKLSTDPEMAGSPAADVSRNVEMRTNYQVQFMVPGQSQPVDAFGSPLEILYFPGIDALIPKDKEADAAERAKALAKLPLAPPLSAALHLGHVRAVLGHPRSAADVDALVAAMQKLGLNSLLLDVFSGGVNHVKTSGANGTDILTEVLARTQGTDIAVYADLSLLTWGDAPPESVQDLTIDGQNSRQAAIETHQINPTTEYDGNDEPISFTAPPVAVSPSSPEVQATLTALMQSLAAQSGLTGCVWEDADTDDDLGYTLDRRLSFLRSAHADPVDTTEGLDTLQAKTKLPLFDDSKIDTAVGALWTKAQTEVNTSLLEQLRSAALTNSNPPILMEQGWDEHSWYASWDNPKSQPPPQRDLTFDGDYAANIASIKQTARTQGHIVLRREVIESDGNTTALARKLQDDAKILPGDGFVLDFSQDEVTQGAAPLSSLVEAAAAEHGMSEPSAGNKTPQKTVN